MVGLTALVFIGVTALALPSSGGLRVGVSAVEFQADDSHVIAGGITPGKARGQEGKLRAVATVLQDKQNTKVAIVACDILMMKREHLDPVTVNIETKTGISRSNILINCTHTHHAPSTMILHGYGLEDEFTQQVQQKVVQAVEQANANIGREECSFYFGMGREETVGENSRQLLDDGMIYWIGPRTNFVRATGPFDPDLSVLGFRDKAQKWRAILFNHSTHTIGTRTPGVRSPSFYGLAAQELESELGGTVSFLEGASGSTHNLKLGCDEAVTRIKAAVRVTLSNAVPQTSTQLAVIKQPFTFHIRKFDEQKEDAAVSTYCQKYAPGGADTIIKVFRDMRRELAPDAGAVRQTWLQVMRIGDVAIAAVPAEYFTSLGVAIKKQSPFKHTFVAELANDWIGYLPDREGHRLGGYQVWTGFHSYAEPGTGERIVEEIVKMFHELKAAN